MDQPVRGFSFYWRFYWPLTLMGLTAVIGRQVQNGVLARYPNAVQEIATFAIASSVFQFFIACFSFVPQMTNVMVKGIYDFRFVIKFVSKVIFVQFLVLMLMSQTPFGKSLMGLAFSLSSSVQGKVNFYLLMMIPNLFLNSFTQVYIGLLIKFEKTKAVTISNVVYLSLMVVGLFFGLWLDLNIVYTLVGSQIFANLIQLLGTRYYSLKSSRFVEQNKCELTTKALWQFFWPIGLTSTMFSFTRPVIYSFVSRLPDGVVIIAALRLAFDFNMIFQNMINQFRHLYITYAKDDLRGVIRFMLQSASLVTLVMILIVSSSFMRIVLVNLMGISEKVSAMSEQIFWVLCLLPFIICVRNFFHGRSMLKRKTLIMGMAAVLRVGGTALITWIFVLAGLLNHVTAGVALVFGFLIELAVNAAQYGFKIEKKNHD